MPGGPYLVAGLGRAGGAAAEALLTHAPDERLLAWDQASTNRLRGVAKRLGSRGVEIQLGGDGLALLAAAGPGVTVIKSPGMDLDAPILLSAGATEGATIIDELELGWRLSRRPIVGVTGTNGKSTTCRLVAAVLKAAGHSVELAGNTEFGSPLSGVADSDWTVCEVSSFQLECSPSFLPEIAVFTNLTPEHLTRHLTMESYGEAKRRMFVGHDRAAPCAVLNLDDPLGRRLAGEVAEAGGRVLSYGFAEEADVHIEQARWDMRHSALTLDTPAGSFECVTRLPGEHNARNTAAAIAVGLLLEVPVATIKPALAAAEAPPGRWELMAESQPFDVLVDYAHTPDGIRQLLQTVRRTTADRGDARVRTVFGAVGLRDADKARQSARLARALSDQLILTTGSAPREARIPRLQELCRAAREEGEVEIVLERPAAIRHAIACARPGDVVAILGLGALRRQVVDAAGTALANDDRQVVREVLAGSGASSWS